MTVLAERRGHELMQEGEGEPSSAIRQRVERARAVQRKRLPGSGPACNAAMGSRQVREHCRLDSEREALLRSAVEKIGLSARGITRVLKVGRTIADLDGAGVIGAEHLAEAVQYRSLRRGVL